MIIEPRTILERLPSSLSQKDTIQGFRKTVQAILSGEDQRLLLIVGPCSIHDIDAAKEYAKRLKALSETVKDTFFIVMRTYFEKSRTALGWKGMMADPFMNEEADVITGITKCREFLLYLASLQLPAGAEFLDPHTVHFTQDLVSWGSIGARTSQSLIHRQLASYLPMAVGFKNTTDGNIQHAVHAAKVAHLSHSFLHINETGRLVVENSRGNIFPHVVLRGGKQKSNFDAASIQEAASLMQQEGLPPAIVIDCAHDNSDRDPKKQRHVFCHLVDEGIAQMNVVRGIMLESYLNEGSQEARAGACPYTSVTDPCLDWNTTEALIKYANTRLNHLHAILSTQ